MSNPICYMMIGLPYSGKSTWIKNHEPELPIASSDQFIEAIAFYCGSTYSEVFKETIDDAITYMNNRRQWLIKNQRDFIHDQTNLTRKKRKKLIEELKANGYEIIGVYFDIPEDLHNQRIASRPDKTVPEHVMENMRRNIDPPSYDEGFDVINIVRN